MLRTALARNAQRSRVYAQMRSVLRIIPPDQRFVLSALIPADVIPAEDQVRIVEPIGRLDIAGRRDEPRNLRPRYAQRRRRVHRNLPACEPDTSTGT